MSDNQLIRVGGVPEHFNLPWHMAIESGKFRAANLNVQYDDFPGGTGQMTQALREEKLDLAIVLSEGAVADILNHDTNRIVKVYVESPLIWGIHVDANSGINSVDEIEGQRYAISRRGSGSHLMAMVDAAERQWATKSMSFVDVGGLAGARKALDEGDAEVFFWERFTTQPLVDNGEFRRVGQREIPWPSFVVSVRKSLIEQNRSMFYRVLSIINATCDELMQQPDAVDVISQRYQLARTETAQWFAHTRWSTDFCKPTVEIDRVIHELNELGIISRPNATVDDVWFDLESDR